MAEFWMTCKHHSARGRWERCQAKTLRGAKREASNEYSGMLRESVLEVGEAAGYDAAGLPDIIAVARKVNYGFDRWADCE